MLINKTFKPGDLVAIYQFKIRDPSATAVLNVLWGIAIILGPPIVHREYTTAHEVYQLWVTDEFSSGSTRTRKERIDYMEHIGRDQ